jgi:signal transduction histidine kinase
MRAILLILISLGIMSPMRMQASTATSQRIEIMSDSASSLYKQKRYQEAAALFQTANDLQAQAYRRQLAQVQSEYAHLNQLKKQESSNNQSLVMYLSVCCVLIVLSFLIIIFIRHRVNKKLARNNKQLQMALERAKESDNMKTSFIQHVSHEIRTPINIITGYAQILSTSDYQLDEATRKQMMTDLDKQTQEIIGSVNELLELSEAESHQYYIRNDKVKLNVLCQALLDEQKLRTDKPLEMQTKLLTADHLVVNTNEEALKKVIRHLLQNAIKFTDRGRITLSTQPLPDGVQIIVEDTGTGIPVKYQEKVFEKFFKIDTFKQGMGLGLTVSRHIARLMGGDLLIDPAYTGGTRFVFTLKKEAKD